MYIELFLLDNLLMDLLILRLAAAMLSVGARRLRLGLVALFGAAAAALAAGGAGFLYGLPAKLGLTLIMSFALPGKSVRCRLYAFLAVLLSAAIVGGAVLLIALILGESLVSGGIGIPAALLGLFASCFLPKAIRRLLSRRVTAEQTVRLRAEFACGPVECAALIDTGNALTEPVTGLPVVLLSRRKYPAAAALARIPVPIRTAGGTAVIFALRPNRLLIGGVPVNALVAFSSAETALVPPAVLPAA